MNKTVEYFDKLITSLKLDSDNMNEMEMFGEMKYRFSLYLINADSKLFKISRTNIQELVLIDDIMDWFHHGHVVFNNPKDILERSRKIFGANGKEMEVVPYRFRSDARDFIYLRMDPYLGDGEQRVNEELNSIAYSMRFLFCVYAMEDISPDNNPNTKMQKLYFHDYRLQMLREKNTYYSTAKYPRKLGENTNVGTNVKQKTNEQRSKTTGEIIQDLLSVSLMEQDTTGLFSRNWEFGDQEMFYTSPANNKAIDDINYVLNKHVSSAEHEHEPCILKLERYTDRWELLPLSKYFDRSRNGDGPGAYQTERFLLASDLDMLTENTIPVSKKTFDEKQSHPLINYHYPEISVLSDYNFYEMNGSDCQDVLNSVIVNRYDEGEKTFSIDIETGNIQNVWDMFQERYTDKMKGGEGGKGYTAWTVDRSRVENLNMNVTESWTPNKSLSLVDRNKKLLGAMLLGNGIQFKSKGIPTRRSGVWISVDIEMSYEDTDYESKVLGQYFVTRTEHIITSTEYRNVVTGVKPYLYENPNFSTGDMFYKEPEQAPNSN